MEIKKIKIKNFSRGQGLVEYVLIVALIAVTCILAVQFLGQTIRVKMAQISGSLGANVQGVRAPRMPTGMTSRKDMKTFFQEQTSE